MISVLEIEDRVGEMVQQVKGLAGQAWQLNLNSGTHIKSNIWSCASVIPVLHSEVENGEGNHFEAQMQPAKQIFKNKKTKKQKTLP